MIAGKYHVKKLLFFSLSRYTEWFRELKNEAVVLFTLEDMYDENPNHSDMPGRTGDIHNRQEKGGNK